MSRGNKLQGQMGYLQLISRGSNPLHMKIWNCFSTAMALSPVFVLSFFHFVYFLSFNLRFNVTNPLVASCKQECKAIKSELPRIVQGYKQEPLQLTDPPALLQRKTNSQSKQQCLGVSALRFFFYHQEKAYLCKMNRRFGRYAKFYKWISFVSPM